MSLRVEEGPMREPQDFSPWWLTAPFCLADRLWLSGQKGNAHCVCSDSLRSLLSHFPFQLKLGKIRMRSARQIIDLN